MKYTLNQVVD